MRLLVVQTGHEPQLQLWSPQRRTTCRTRCPVGLSRSTARKFGATLSWPSPATVRRPGTDRWTCGSTTSTVTGTTFWSRSTGVHREARLPNGSSPTSDPDATRATRTAALGRRDLGCLRDPVRAGRAGRAAGRRLRRRPGDLESRAADHLRRDRHRDPRRPLEGRPVSLAGPGPGQRGCHVLAAGGPGGGAELRVVPGPGDGRGAGEYGSLRRDRARPVQGPAAAGRGREPEGAAPRRGRPPGDPGAAESSGAPARAARRRRGGAAGEPRVLRGRHRRTTAGGLRRGQGAGRDRRTP